jgi:hypothetical protein
VRSIATKKQEPTDISSNSTGKRKNYQNHRHYTLVPDVMYIVDIAHYDAENYMGQNTHHKMTYCRCCGESVESSLIA